MADKFIQDYIGHDRAHTATVTLSEMEGMSDTRRFADMLNAKQAAMVAVVEAAREYRAEYHRPQTGIYPRIIDCLNNLCDALDTLDALTPDPDEDDTRELQAVEPELPQPEIPVAKLSKFLTPPRYVKVVRCSECDSESWLYWMDYRHFWKCPVCDRVHAVEASDAG